MTADSNLRTFDKTENVPAKVEILFSRKQLAEESYAPADGRNIEQIEQAKMPLSMYCTSVPLFS